MSVAVSSASSHLAHYPEKTLTPSSYLEYSFTLPDKRYVGLLACQRDPLLTILVTEVVRCVKTQPPTNVTPVSTAGMKVKKGKAGVSPPVEPVKNEWEIELMDTVLFPEGGGQPSDTGLLIPLDPSLPTTAQENPATVEPIKVREVLRRNLDAIHFANAPLPVGQQVLVKLDKDQRKDKMCQHTGQHLLSAFFDTLGLETLSWSLTPSPQPCYIELPRCPTSDEITQVQDRCNEAIAEGRRLKVRMEQLGVIEGAGAKAIEAHDKMPENYKDSDGDRPSIMRTVEIEDLDKNPCCGTHYPSLSYLQSLFILPQTSSIRGTNYRLYFLVGPRVLSYLALTHQATRASATELGCTVADLEERVVSLQSNYKDELRKGKRLQGELAESVVDDLQKQALQVESTGWGVFFKEEDSTNSLDFLSSIAIMLKDARNSSETSAPQLFCLACGSSPGASTAATGSLVVVGSSDDLVTKLGKLILQNFEGRIKGGGKGRWQGKLMTGTKWAKNDKSKLEQLTAQVIAEAL